MKQLVPLASHAPPALLAAADERADARFAGAGDGL
jgi:hypothetical protein